MPNVGLGCEPASLGESLGELSLVSTRLHHLHGNTVEMIVRYTKPGCLHIYMCIMAQSPMQHHNQFSSRTKQGQNTRFA